MQESDHFETVLRWAKYAQPHLMASVADDWQPHPEKEKIMVAREPSPGLAGIHEVFLIRSDSELGDIATWAATIHWSVGSLGDWSRRTALTDSGSTLQSFCDPVL